MTNDLNDFSVFDKAVTYEGSNLMLSHLGQKVSLLPISTREEHSLSRLR